MISRMTRGTSGHRLIMLLAGAAVLLVTGCAAPSGGTAATPTRTAETTPGSDVISVVAIGDSIPYNSPQDCPGCTGFVDSFAEALAESTGEPVEAINRSRHDGAQTADILEEVQSGSLDDVLGTANLVIVSAGYNDQPPYGDEGEACYAAQLDTEADAVAAVLATTPECIATQTATTAEDLAGVLDGVRERAPEASLLVLTAYDSWTGWSAVEAAGPEAAASVSTTIVAALDAWRTAACAAAVAVDGECVDLLAGFNGPDATSPSGDLLAADYTHPSQSGNDLIRDLLLATED